MGRDARGAPAARAAALTAVATTLAAVAASVVLGLGNAQAAPQVTAPDLRAAPRVTPAPPATAEPDEVDDPELDDGTDDGSGHGDSERDAPQRLRAAAPRPPQATPQLAAPPAESDVSRPTGRSGVPAGDGGSLRAAGTPCTVAARACVALDERQAWLLDGGTVVRGPVPMQHGDAQTPTPRGTFTVQWKAEEYTSREYLTQMPFSVFFAEGGVAFHEGAQSRPSAGCVKLGHEDAEAFFAFLQVGDEVQIH